MTTKKRRWLFIGFLIVVVIGWAMGQFDYARLVAGKRPVFAPVRLYCNDGGSVEYWGLGYIVTDKHEIRWGGELQPDARMTAPVAPFPIGPTLDYGFRIKATNGTVVPFCIGPTLDYWTPFISREHTRFIDLRHYQATPLAAIRAHQRIDQLHPGMTAPEVWQTLGLTSYGFSARTTGSGDPQRWPSNYRLWPGYTLYCCWNLDTNPPVLIEARFRTDWQLNGR